VAEIAKETALIVLAVGLLSFILWPLAFRAMCYEQDHQRQIGTEMNRTISQRDREAAGP